MNDAKMHPATGLFELTAQEVAAVAGGIGDEPPQPKVVAIGEEPPPPIRLTALATIGGEPPPPKVVEIGDQPPPLK